MKNYKAKKKNGAIKAVAAIVLSAIMLAGGCAVGYGAGTHWTYKRDGAQATVPDGGSEIRNEQNSMLITEGESAGAKFSAHTLKAEEYQEYEIDAQKVESAYVATVTLANHNEATDKSITLTAKFDDGQSASEYISFSSMTVQSGESFTISCLKAFGKPITIKATANGVESGAKPTCSIKADYVRRFKAVYMLGGEVEDDGTDMSQGMYLENVRLGGSNEKGEMCLTVHAACASIFIKAGDSSNDMSEGTITEGISNVKFDVGPLGATGQMWDAMNSETNEFDAYPSSEPLHLFYHWDEDDNYQELISIYNYARGCAGNYSQVLDKYNKKEASFEISVQFTGKITGIVYEFTTGIIINPEGLYTNAQNPSFDTNTSGGIIF